MQLTWMVLRNGSSRAFVSSAPHSVVSQRDRVTGLKVDSVTVSRADVPVSAQLAMLCDSGWVSWQQPALSPFTSSLRSLPGVS